jgi:hypothetical protein
MIPKARIDGSPSASSAGHIEDRRRGGGNQGRKHRLRAYTCDLQSMGPTPISMLQMGRGSQFWRRASDFPIPESYSSASSCIPVQYPGSVLRIRSPHRWHRPRPRAAASPGGTLRMGQSATPGGQDTRYLNATPPDFQSCIPVQHPERPHRIRSPHRRRRPVRYAEGDASPSGTLRTCRDPQLRRGCPPPRPTRAVRPSSS